MIKYWANLLFIKTKDLNTKYHIGNNQVTQKHKVFEYFEWFDWSVIHTINEHRNQLLIQFYFI